MTVPLKTAENNSKTEIIGRKGCGKNLKTISNHNKISGTNIFLEMAHTATANRENKESNGSEREESATPRNQRHLKEEDLLIVLRRSILVTER